MSTLTAVTTTATFLTAGSTYRFKLQPTKNKVAWDLTGAVVTVKFRDPDGTRSAFAATVDVDGTAHFDCATTLLLAGDWQRSWHVVQGAIDVTSLPIAFGVTDSPE